MCPVQVVLVALEQSAEQYKYCMRKLVRTGPGSSGEGGRGEPGVVRAGAVRLGLTGSSAVVYRYA